MHNNLLKSGNIVKKDNARVIDSNEKIAARIQYLNEILMREPEVGFSDDFTEGLAAEQVELLLDDNGGEDTATSGMQTGIGEEEYAAMKEAAENEAAEIVAEAQAEAKRIVDKANQDSAQLREDAKASGYDEGYQNGEAEALKIAEAAKLECEARENELQAYYQQKLEELEPVFIEKLTDIYEHIFRVDLSDKKELIMYLLSDAMRNIDGSKNFFIHVSKEDYDFVSENREDLTRGLPSSAVVEVIEDISLAKAQCFIEAEAGIFDCGLDTELALLKKELTLLSYRKD